MGLAQNPDYATEVTLQPIDRYGIDAAILFSDILTVPDAMGLGLSFVAGEGPVFARPVQTEEDVARLYVPDPNVELKYVTDAVSSIRRALNNRVPLIGFSGSPFTLACYMIEGRGSRDFRTVKTMMYRRPDLLHRILDVNARAVASYLNAQIKAGAQAVQIFDTWGGMLADGDFQAFSLRYTKQVLDALIRENDGEAVPSIVFTKGGGEWLSDIAATGCDAVGLDWTVNLTRARTLIGDRVALQGNRRPARSLRRRRKHPPRSASRSRRLRQRFGPRLQPRARHQSVHPDRERSDSRRRSSRLQPSLPRSGDELKKLQDVPRVVHMKRLSDNG